MPYIGTFGAPVVVEKSPEHGEYDVAPDVEIRVKFSNPLEEETVDNSTFIVAKNAQTPIQGTVSYEARTQEIVFVSDSPFEASTTYQVTIVGDPIAGDDEASGIKDIFGQVMGANVTWIFTIKENQEAPAPVLLSPHNESALFVTRPTFEWELNADPDRVQLLLSEQASFALLTWPSNDGEFLVGSISQVSPELELESGHQYFWKVRQSVGSDWGGWSDIYTFAIGDLDDPTPYTPPVDTDYTIGSDVDLDKYLTGSVVSEVGSYPPAIEFVDDFRIIGTIPFNGETAADKDVFLVQFNKDIDPASISDDSIVIEGRSILPGADEHHGRVPGRILIDKNKLVFIPNEA